MQNDYFINLIKQDWPDQNLQILKYCKELAEKAVEERMADYPPTPHQPFIRGVMVWDRLDYYLDRAAKDHLFEGITSEWVPYQGAQILELRGKYSSVTACHVLSPDDAPKESDRGYRKNNRAKNQKNLELFKEYETPDSEEEPYHVIFQHGSRDGDFGFLRIYLEDKDIPVITLNIMLMQSPEMTPDTELVLKPVVVLKDNMGVSKPENLPTVPVETNTNDDSQS
jgi:hypothetical protein